MTELWITIAAVAVASATIKAAGPVLLGARELPARASGIIALLAPALLAALVVVQTFGDDRGVVLDERALGVVVTGLACLRRAPPLLAIALGVATTALVRAVG